MSMNIEIANRLQKLRKEKGYSQEQLAEELGISRQAVSKWERAESSPDTENLICLAKLYNVSLDYLLACDNTIEEIKENKKTIEEPVNKENNKHENPVAAIAIFLIVIAYLLIGFLCNLWHPGWIMFLFYPATLSLIDAVNKRKMMSFQYPVLVTGVYLILGFLVGLWHPGWIVFLTIPIYYVVAKTVDKV